MFVNGTEIYKFKAKDCQIVASPLCLGNISRDWSTDNMKKTGFNGYVYYFSADYVFPFSIETNKCSGSCNNINYLYAKICIPDVVKNLNVKIFNLMTGTNEARFIEWHETCKCECKFGENVCNNKQRWNKNKCRCECKELTDKGVCDKGFVK